MKTTTRKTAAKPVKGRPPILDMRMSKLVQEFTDLGYTPQEIGLRLNVTETAVRGLMERAGILSLRQQSKARVAQLIANLNKAAE